jgi:hypothetical protein
MNEKEVLEQLDNFVVNLEIPVKQLNSWLNAWNQPNQTPTIFWYDMITTAQAQAGPQVEQAKKSLETLAKSAEKEVVDE